MMRKSIYIRLIILALFLLLIPAFMYFRQEKVVEPVLQNVAQDASKPETLIIPKIKVEADISEVGVTAKGEMATPEDPGDAGWYRFGPVPGLKGSAVLAGHLDTAAGGPAVFARLDELVVGDDVYVINEKGDRLTFKVVAKKTYDYDIPDTREVFGPVNEVHRLNLITCNGAWLKSSSVYSKRLVVFTEQKIL